MVEVNAAKEQNDSVKRTRHRSPNYPSIALDDAVNRAKVIHEKYKRAQVPINLAHEAWGYQAHSGAGNQAVAALKAYGLLDVDGDGKGRKVRVSESAYRILLGSPDRAELLKKAAVSPPIHSELWNKFKDEGLPAELVRHYLIFERADGTFNADSVDAFTEQFRASLRYANLLSSDIVKAPPSINVNKGFAFDGDSGSDPVPVKVGDLVQWTCAGSDMFPEPRPVLGFSDDGDFAFVLGTNTGIPVEQITVVGQAMNPSEDKKTPPANPFKDAALPSAKTHEPLAGFKEDAYDLAEGRAVVRWPEKLDPASVEELEDWFDLIIRKMRRTSGLEPKAKKT